MKQVLQNLKTGVVEVADVPCPIVRPGHLLIQSRATLISAGTERMLVEFGKSSLLAKAKAQPDKVRQVLDKIKADGLLPTLQTVFARLDEPLPLGYCNAGIVIAIGDGVHSFKPGDRVISNGPHAEMVCVPSNLCAKIPEGVSDEEAAFTVLGSIGLQGIRLIEPTIGETIAVTGLGLIGLMTVQMLLANGCKVLGIDIDPERLKMARNLGADVVDLPSGADPVAVANSFSEGRGVDGVIITASSKSNEIIKQAAQMCRKRGRIALVGVIGLELSRSDFYKKELSFQVSCSYGPGRYDPNYEDKGNDYPLGFVRWTEQRNFEAILSLLASKRMDVTPLISERIEHKDSVDAYGKLTGGSDALGIILEYPDDKVPNDTVVKTSTDSRPVSSGKRAVVGIIGAGNFCRATAAPILKKSDAVLSTIVDLDPVAASHVARKFGLNKSTTDYKTILTDGDINTVFVFTRHNLHARFVLEAIEAGKHVFVEKPLCLTHDELTGIRDAYKKTANRQQLVVGFNRRFSPHARKIKDLLRGRNEPLCMSMMVNAGISPPDSWVHDPNSGGGRIIGEGCHWIDLMSFICDAPVTRVQSTMVGETAGLSVRNDKATITLTFADGSIGTLHYFGNGHKSYRKETFEVFTEGKILRCENFVSLQGFGIPGFKKMNLRRMDKGHDAEFCEFVDGIANGSPPLIPFEQLENVTLATLAAENCLHTGEPMNI